MINAAIVGSNLKSAMFAAPNVDQQFGEGQGKHFVHLVMSQMAEMGIPGAQGLAPRTQVLGGAEQSSEPSSQAFAAAVQNLGRSFSRD